MLACSRQSVRAFCSAAAGSAFTCSSQPSTAKEKGPAFDDQLVGHTHRAEVQAGDGTNLLLLRQFTISVAGS